MQNKVRWYVLSQYRMHTQRITQKAHVYGIQFNSSQHSQDWPGLAGTEYFQWATEKQKDSSKAGAQKVAEIWPNFYTAQPPFTISSWRPEPHLVSCVL